MNINNEDCWIVYFRNNGYPETVNLAKGMEGAVYSLKPGGLIAKVWLTKSEAELSGIKYFYHYLTAQSISLQTPEILDIIIVDGTSITIETHLHGTPLETYISLDTENIDSRAIDATIEVLRVLRKVPTSEIFSCLSLIGENCTVVTGKRKWSGAVSNVLSRQMEKSGSQIRSIIPDMDEMILAIHSFLLTRDYCPMSIIHGDVWNGNILVDEQLKPLSVLDFSFLLPIGDPAFDASISGATFNMYAPFARQIDDRVTKAISESLDYDQKVLLAYRAVYAIMTSNLYSVEGSDGHFKWCMTMLKRGDVRQALGL